MLRSRIRPVTTRPLPWGNVVPLPENRSAIRSVQRVASGRTAAASPLLLHGPPGVGKSVLVGTLLTEFLQSPVGHSARQLSALELPRKSRTTVETDFSDLTETDLLIVEDLQHLPARDVGELCQILDERLAHHRPTVLTATSGPAGLAEFPRRLTNRLAAGLVVRLDVPGIASRRILIEHFAADRSLNLTSEAIDWMARAAEGIRPLLGLIEKLKPVVKGFPAPLTVAQVQEWLLEPTLSDSKPRLQKIISRVAAAFEVKSKDLLGPSRLRAVLLPRQVAMALARELSGLSLVDIGRHFGGRDHTTVLHALKKIETLVQDNETLAGRLRELRAELE